MSSVADIISGQMTSRKAALKDSEVAFTTPITYVLVREGIMKVVRNRLGTFYKLHKEKKSIDVADVADFMRSAPETLDYLPLSDMRIKDVAEFLKVNPDVCELMTQVMTTTEVKTDGLKSISDFPPYDLAIPKIPAEFIHQISTFFRAVFIKQKTEAAVFIRYNAERGHYIEVPEQDLSGGHVKYQMDTKNPDPVVMDIHSHHTMSPFFSGTDNADEKSTQFYAVVGHIQLSVPAVNIRVRMDGEDIATLPVEAVFDLESYPNEWMTMIKEPPIPLSFVKGKKSPDGCEMDERRMGESRCGRTSEEFFGEDVAARGGYPRRWGSGSEDGPRTVDEHHGLDDPSYVEAADSIWKSIEDGLFDYPNVFDNPENLERLRKMISDRLDEVNPGVSG